MERIWRSLTVVGLLGALPARILATEVELELDPAIAWAQSPVTLRVRIVDPEEKVRSPEIPETEGLEIRGPVSQGSEQNIVGNKARRVIVLTYEVTPTTTRKGKHTVGPVTVTTQSGKTIRSKTAELLVYDRPEVGVQVETELERPSGPVGAPFRVTYRVLYFGESGGDEDAFGFARRGNSIGLTGLQLPLLELGGVKVEPVASIDGAQAQKLVIGNRQEVILQQGVAERGGKGYLTLVFAFDVTPMAPGPVALGGARATMRFRTGRVTTRPGFFGERMRVPEEKDYQGEAPPAVYTVNELPTVGRPAGFNGAVGNYSITVGASPTEVDEGAPITLEIRVTGRGMLEELKPAAWTEVESLTKDFQVSPDVDSGKLESGARVFRQVIRPKSSSVTAIPSIPFPFFEPAEGKYKTVQSQPIPIQVRAVKVVRAEAAAAQPQQQAQASAVPRASTAQSSPILELGGVGANFDAPGDRRQALDPREELSSATFLAGVFLPPLAFAGVAASRRLARRDPRLRRRAQALNRALRAAREATDPVRAAAACEEYFRDRFGLPAGEVTPADVRRVLARAGAPPLLQESAASLIERAHAARFGAGTLGSDLSDEVERTLREVDSCTRD